MGESCRDQNGNEIYERAGWPRTNTLRTLGESLREGRLARWVISVVEGRVRAVLRVLGSSGTDYNAAGGTPYDAIECTDHNFSLGHAVGKKTHRGKERGAVIRASAMGMWFPLGCSRWQSRQSAVGRLCQVNLQATGIAAEPIGT